MSTCFPRLSHMSKKIIFPVPTTCETNPESIRGFYDWQIWPSGTQTGITSSRNFGSPSRKLGWKLDFRGCKSIGGRTHNSIGAERYGHHNIDDLHYSGLPLPKPLPFGAVGSGFALSAAIKIGAVMGAVGNLQFSPWTLQNNAFLQKFFKLFT